ncbi:LysM peptidoglycan-binding domain-containing protein [Chryseobacterium sp. SNU WT5]|uniref:LysM peptidoglycan-binding domain-containing protein n=1 Tax=Chryseobacterium sp. SNU WT5 TaxID=2594269 RepID=UPI00117F2F18|nr:LysM domain-containing protein [Chryseobacterium sp. SNU WT5]QDP85770.1 LysM peptidoglycan-binding domain-containing protein [Chryseobacterium sp. SNU WT5]
MLNDLLIYQIKTNDTLTSIAEEIGMSSQELLNFHNSNCQKVGLLWFNGLAGIEKIVIPKNYKSEAQIRKEIDQSLPSQNLAPAFFAASYHCKESFLNAGEKTMNLEYEVEVALRENEEESSSGLIASVKCFSFKKDGRTPDDKMSELSISCIDSINPLLFDVAIGGTIKGIPQFKKLAETFAAKRIELEDFFTGEVSQKYMDKFAGILDNEAYFLSQIQSTLLYQLLFPKMDFFYQRKAKLEPFCPVKNSFPADFLFETTYEHVSEQHLKTIMSGKIAEAISLPELLRGRRSGEEPEEALEAGIILKYTTDKETKELQNAKALITLQQDGELYKEQHIELRKN